MSFFAPEKPRHAAGWVLRILRLSEVGTMSDGEVDRIEHVAFTLRDGIATRERNGKRLKRLIFAFENGTGGMHLK